MGLSDRDSSTICALASGRGRSGIAVLRVSGPNSLNFVRKICEFLPSSPDTHKSYFGELRNSKGIEIIDQVLVTFFAKGRSFTGEETLEISCHGSPIVYGQILTELVHVGCRIAERGEFTYRSLMNGCMDLIQAESTLALIESTSKRAARVAASQLSGQLGQLFSGVEAGVIRLLAEIEAAIDFSVEGIETQSSENILVKVELILKVCTELLESHKRGRVLASGLRIVLSGRPNAGKSSLLNYLVGENRAIVSEEPGTTRDTIDVSYSLGGIPSILTDTAGLREAVSGIEKMGISRSWKSIETADIVVFVVDATVLRREFEVEMEMLNQLVSVRGKGQVLLAINKCDQISSDETPPIGDLFLGFNYFFVSALDGRGIGLLTEALKGFASFEEDDAGVVIIQNRQYELILKISECLRGVKSTIGAGLSSEFACPDLRMALKHLEHLRGKNLEESVLDDLFGKFCIGK